MKYLLDTGPLRAYLLGRQGVVARFAALIRQGELATSSLIAATALAHGLTVITIDGDFTRVPGLSHQVLTLTQVRTP